MDRIIIANDLTKIFNKYKTNQLIAINKISIEIKEGDFICIMGKSGSGKTTLLNILSTIDDYDSGNLKILGYDINNISEKEKAKLRETIIGYIFQDYNLLDSLTIEDNICFSSIVNKDVADRKSLYDILKKLHIMDIRDKYPYECSGGQRQRAAIARALLQKPKILFDDEPTGNLDSKNTIQLMKQLISLNKKGITIVMVTHDCKIASYSNNVYFINDGKIVKKLEKNNNVNNEFYKNIVDYNFRYMEANYEK